MLNVKKPWLYNVERKPPVHAPHGTLRLDKSERIYGFSVEDYNDFLKTLIQDDFLLYPDVTPLTNRIAEKCNVSVDNVNISYGSDHIIKAFFEIFVKSGSNIVSTVPSFPMYKVYGDLFNAKFNPLPYNKNLTYDINDFEDIIDNDTSLVILANPNSPIGDSKTIDEIEELAEHTNVRGIPLLIDEAYYEFNDYISCIDLTKKFDNVSITRTFSKAYGAAGCRIGYCISGKTISMLLRNVKPMFESCGASIKFAEFVMNRESKIKKYVNSIVSERNKLARLFTNKYDVINSKSNWIHINNKFDNVDTDKILNNHKIFCKNNLSIPFDDRRNWIRMSITPMLSDCEGIKQLI